MGETVSFGVHLIGEEQAVTGQEVIEHRRAAGTPRLVGDVGILGMATPAT